VQGAKCNNLHLAFFVLDLTVFTFQFYSFQLNVK
jgi:hypothetical protein